MGEIVYVDLFFLINFSMDFLCFFLTAKLLHHRLSVGRGLLGAAVGGLYADIALFLRMGMLGSILLDAAVCAVMCLVVFYQKKQCFRLPLYLLVYIAASMTLGGVMTALFHWLNRSSAFGEIESEGDGISIWIFALLALVSGIITLLGGRFFRSKSSGREATITVYYEGNRVSFEAMVDSGNLLREPISGRPCIVVDTSVMKGVLPRELLLAAKGKELCAMERLSAPHQRHVRLIPTRTASGQGMLLGVRPQRILVKTSGKEREIDAVIALAELGRSGEERRALLPSQLLI